jgi:predicted deacetylase
MSWAVLTKAIEENQKAGTPISFWLRDDDAFQDNEKVRRLLSLCKKYSTPIAWAVVPGKLEHSLVQLFRQEGLVTVVQHGYEHINHGKGSGTSGEFQYHRPLAELKAEAVKGKDILKENFGHQFLPIFVPPWNQISDPMIAELPKLGFQGLSRFGTEVGAFPIAICNSNCDLIKWKPHPHFAGEEKTLSVILAELQKGNRKIGILTHHLDHDAETELFLEKLMTVTVQKKCDWISIAKVFS